MKNSLVNLLFAIIVSIGIVEGIQLGFHFMTLPDTIFFYLGLTIVVTIAFLVGWFIIKELNKMFTSDEENSEENDETKK
jgi:Kef-type K+ transport system membrane component KefB